MHGQETSIRNQSTPPRISIGYRSENTGLILSWTAVCFISDTAVQQRVVINQRMELRNRRVGADADLLGITTFGIGMGRSFDKVQYL
jgi:hypothetical protein